ncbi:MAG: sodium:solute symporter [Opitutaceae bacterium]|nr:sodium:solute symporter [Opitutaceae bacterium]
MSALDYFVLVATMLGIAAYGMWKTRGRTTFQDYVKGESKVSWGTIGLAVMATQASAITFLSTPGQGFESGMGFVQNYFGLPFALIVVAALFLPFYRRLKVLTAYEYLGRRFDGKTRLLGACLFLLQRGLASGITIYAPAIVLSTVFGWNLDLTILATGALAIVYTVSGGNTAVSITQKYQMIVIFAGMATAFVIMLLRLPAGVTTVDALQVAAGFDKLNAVNFSFDINERYTLWSGIFGGFFLSLSYFGTDQSQVGRYLSGTSLRESRLGLMFNAVFKIPMQAFILLLGVLLFVFYQFSPAPVFFDRATWRQHVEAPGGETLRVLESRYQTLAEEKRAALQGWLKSRHDGSSEEQVAAAKGALRDAHARSEAVRKQAKDALRAVDPGVKTKDSDYVFITFILEQLPVGVVGLLIAVIFAAALSSVAAELSALGSTTVVDLYRHIFRPAGGDGHGVLMSKVFTASWGFVAIGFALFARLAENLIEAVNILGSLFYGVVLGLFLVAFLFRRVGGNAVFTGALLSQATVLVCFFTLDRVGYLWYNLIGCALCVFTSLILQPLLGGRTPGGTPATAS